MAVVFQSLHVREELARSRGRDPVRRLLRTFADAAAILRHMHALLKWGGRGIVNLDHPVGGHIYSTFCFRHLLFSDAALVRRRSTIKSDSARPVLESGLNTMTVAGSSNSSPRVHSRSRRSRPYPFASCGGLRTE